MRGSANWITPLDREDIRSLTHGMDDILDRIDAVAERVVVYRMDVATEEAVELARLLVSSCDALAVAVRSLSGHGRDGCGRVPVRRLARPRAAMIRHIRAHRSRGD